jgi:hypothetical protein
MNYFLKGATVMETKFMDDREKHEHISLKCKDYPNGKPVLAIHNKKGKVQAQWEFSSANDLFDFAFMCQEYAEGMQVAAARQKK